MNCFIVKLLSCYIIINVKKLDCAICGKKQKIKGLYPARFSQKKLNSSIFSARRIPDGTHFCLVRCQNCGLIFSNPILPQKQINTYYTGSDFTYGEESEYLKKTYGKLLSLVISSGAKQSPTGTEIASGFANPRNDRMKLLDIGCGNGFFLEVALRLGIRNLYGIEPGISSIQKARPTVRKKIKQGIFKKGMYKKNFFDIVTCFQTLDHVTSPTTFLRDIKEVLKTGGIVLFVVHNTDGLSVKLLGEKSPIFDIEHIYLFNKKSLKLLFAKHGFKNVQVFDVKNTYPLGYWTRMFPIPQFLKQPLMFLFKITKAGTIPFALSAGNIGITA